MYCKAVHKKFVLTVYKSYSGASKFVLAIYKFTSDYNLNL